MNPIAKKLLSFIADYTQGALHIRENGKCVSQHASPNVTITSKKANSGLNIVVHSACKNETVCIPAVVTSGGIDDIVYNDFIIEEGAEVTILSGCGVHTDDDLQARHDGIHHFHIGKNSRVHYIEKHIGTGSGSGNKTINPMSEIEMMEGSFLEMDTTQISGISKAIRKTHATLDAGAKLVVRERLFTQGKESVDTDFLVELNGDDSSADIVSRTVARDHSYQNFVSTIVGKARCKGHSECDSILDEQAIVDSTPRLVASCKEANLIHEAAIGKIAGEQIMKLKTLGLSEEEAENQIIDGFLA